jgi:hypothetical protein
VLLLLLLLLPLPDRLALPALADRLVCDVFYVCLHAVAVLHTVAALQTWNAHALQECRAFGILSVWVKRMYNVTANHTLDVGH